jgi:Protein of unknown function (DUF3987)
LSVAAKPPLKLVADLYSDDESAEVVVATSNTGKLPDKSVMDRLEGRWREACMIAKDSGVDGLEPLFARIASADDSRAAMMREAIQSAKSSHPHQSNQETGGIGGIGGDWPEPKPIRAELLPVPPMTPEMIPQPFRDWTTDIARRVSCPLDFVAVSLIVALSSLIGRSVAIRPTQRNGWTVICNLWGAIVAPPGWLKSPAMAEVMKMINRLVAEANGEHARAIERHNAEVLMGKLQSEVNRERLKAATKAKGKPGSQKDALKDDEMMDLARSVTGFEAAKPPTAKRYIVNDATIERLAEILCENPRGVLETRDELMGLFTKFKDPRHEADRTWFLEAWNGDKRTSTDRIGRGHTNPILCVSILGTVQPGPLAPYIRAASGNGEGNDGLVARFQLMTYPDAVEWRYVDEFPDTAAKNHAFEVIQFLDRIESNPQTVAANMPHEFDPDGVPYLQFDDEAQEVFKDWISALCSGKLVSDTDSSVIISHISKYRSLMPSLALIFHLSAVANGDEPGPVTASAARMAVAWCDYLEAHARRIYQLSFDADPEPGRRLLERIKSGDVPNPFRSAWLYKRGWAGLTTLDDVSRAVQCLERHNIIKTVDVPTTAIGGKPTEDHYIHPSLASSKARV